MSNQKSDLAAQNGSLEDQKQKRFKEAWSKKVEQFNSLGLDRYATEILNLDQTRYKKYSQYFDLIDLNSNGGVSKSEFIAVLNKFSLGKNLSKGEVDEIFESIDKANCGEINLINFLESLSKENPNKSLFGIIEQITSKANEIEEYKKRNVKTSKGTSPKKGREDTNGHDLTTDETTENTTPNGTMEEIKNLHTPRKEGANEAGQQKITNSYDSEERTGIFSPQKNHAGKEIVLEEESFRESWSERNSVSQLPPLDYIRRVLKVKDCDLNDYVQAYYLINVDTQDFLTKNEFKESLKNLTSKGCVFNQDIDKVFKVIDEDKDGKFNLTDFLRTLGNLNKDLLDIVKIILENDKKSSNIQKFLSKDANRPQQEISLMSRRIFDDDDETGREERINAKIEILVKDLSHNKAMNDQVKEELRLSLKYMSDFDLERIPYLVQPERVEYLVHLIAVYEKETQIQNILGRKLENLQKVIEEERALLPKAGQGEERNKVTVVVWVIPFIMTLRFTFYLGWPKQKSD